ncbi:hypothetical protein NPIL_93561 [Nephila pilipes]|uniref:Uncharacterized protein n=1 Tax=Nephila pilipes TaxID=299642 RepID=A0A8X6PB06_NEPPI|nr:hypothetical protein NPIL_370031 [Nephila pilipes]GFT61431.1 hypothetical protein NPIL_93561 [Nephila pilipes]
MAEALREPLSSQARNVFGSLLEQEIESQRSLEEPEPSENHEHRMPVESDKPTPNTKSKQLIFEMAITLRDPRSSQPEKFYEGCRPKSPSLRHYPSLFVD